MPTREGLRERQRRGQRIAKSVPGKPVRIWPRSHSVDGQRYAQSENTQPPRVQIRRASPTPSAM